MVAEVAKFLVISDMSIRLILRLSSGGKNRLNIASKLFGNTKPTETPIKQQNVQPQPVVQPSGFFACSVHREHPAMTYAEFDSHKEREYPYRGGILGFLLKVSQCQPVSIPEGDERLGFARSIAREVAPSIVVREIVLVACRHCGARYSQGTPKCNTCGANL